LRLNDFIYIEHILPEDPRQTEIYHLEGTVLLLCQKQEVFRLQIAVAYLVAVAVVDGLHDLGEDVAGVILLEDACVYDSVE
jgi:steroid 5-alpha reductase family enzyme